MANRITLIEMQPLNPRFEKMKQVWDGCMYLGVSPPPEVVDFFCGRPPLMNDETFALMMTDKDSRFCQRWEADGQMGIQIDLGMLAKGTMALRVIFEPDPPLAHEGQE